MTKPRWIPIVFLASALYDGLLGFIFLFETERLFALAMVTPPNHMGYVQFPACLLLIFAVMFLVIARDPVFHRDLIPYGIMLKLSYCGVVTWHWIIRDLPAIWKPFVVFDIVFAVLFIMAYRALGRPGKAGPS